MSRKVLKFLSIVARMFVVLATFGIGANVVNTAVESTNKFAPLIAAAGMFPIVIGAIMLYTFLTHAVDDFK